MLDGLLRSEYCNWKFCQNTIINYTHGIKTNTKRLVLLFFFVEIYIYFGCNCILLKYVYFHFEIFVGFFLFFSFTKSSYKKNIGSEKFENNKFGGFLWKMPIQWQISSKNYQQFDIVFDISTSIFGHFHVFFSVFFFSSIETKILCWVEYSL